MFQDEAGFGRINTPKYCWCRRHSPEYFPYLHIREYRYAYGTVEPLAGESLFPIMPNCDSDCMNVFLRELSYRFPEDHILLCRDEAA